MDHAKFFLSASVVTILGALIGFPVAGWFGILGVVVSIYAMLVVVNVFCARSNRDNTYQQPRRKKK